MNFLLHANTFLLKISNANTFKRYLKCIKKQIHLLLTPGLTASIFCNFSRIQDFMRKFNMVSTLGLAVHDHQDSDEVASCETYFYPHLHLHVYQ